VVAAIELRDAALSVSAVQGKAFEVEGRLLGHVIDPRSGMPVTGARLAAVMGESATDTDALSTALLVRGAAWLPRFHRLWPESRAWVLGEDQVLTASHPK
jgi:FAD:protein FMN transferase